MPAGVKGIHHITAIAGSPQKNIDFYTKVLGLKLVKKTVNFDDPYTYHLYYGDETGNPGSILTFFPWNEYGSKGRKGNGQVTTISFSINQNSIDYWIERLRKFKINIIEPFKRFDEDVILFEDNDGIEIELIGSLNEKRIGWNNGDIPEENSIRGFHSATLSEEGFDKTAEVLTSLLGFEKVNQEKNRFRFESGEGGAGTLIDVLVIPNSAPGKMGVGANHHIAFRADDDEHQKNIKELLDKNGLNVTPVINRNYFKSIYFREPGNVLFEVATDPPGFLIDENKENLGTHLKLPEWFESKRDEIEKALPPINI